MSQQRYLGKSISAFTVNLVAGTVTGFTAQPGQIGVVCRYVAGGSIEIGGASLAAGNGFLLATSPAATLPYTMITGDLYAIATGATATLTGFRILDAENPGALG